MFRLLGATDRNRKILLYVLIAVAVELQNLPAPGGCWLTKCVENNVPTLVLKFQIDKAYKIL